MRTPHNHAVGVVTVTLAGALLLTACSTSATSTTDPDPAPTTPPAPSTSSPTMSPSPDPTAELDAAVLAAYRGFWRAQVTTLNNPRREPPPALKRYAIDKALADVRASVLIYRHGGIEMRGQPVLDPEISTWSGTPSPSATATIADCVDSTDWQPVYAATGKSAAAPDQNSRVIVESTVVQRAGRWVVRTSVAHRDQSC